VPSAVDVTGADARGGAETTSALDFSLSLARGITWQFALARSLNAVKGAAAGECLTEPRTSSLIPRPSSFLGERASERTKSIFRHARTSAAADKRRPGPVVRPLLLVGVRRARALPAELYCLLFDSLG